MEAKPLKGFSGEFISLSDDFADTVAAHKKTRQRLLLGGAAYTGILASLGLAWYQPQDFSRFHFFNDNPSWLQMDKLGHFMGGYTGSKHASAYLKWAGIKGNRDKAGTLTCLVFLTTVECLDGFSKGWGFSWGDMIANTGGAGFYYWQTQSRIAASIAVKWSYSPSIFAQYRPNLLGKTWYERWLKDYNGQHYWLSLPISKKHKWLALGIGYGARGMLGGLSNPLEINGLPLPFYERSRRFFISPDIRWEHIPVRNKWLKGVFKFISFWKIPLPALEYRQHQGLLLHGLL